jgi:hypothetical protein
MVTRQQEWLGSGDVIHLSVETDKGKSSDDSIRNRPRNMGLGSHRGFEESLVEKSTETLKPF